jgi:hypothetical protein
MKLNGWQRIWVIVSAISVIIYIAIITTDSFPLETSDYDTWITSNKFEFLQTLSQCRHDIKTTVPNFSCYHLVDTVKECTKPDIDITTCFITHLDKYDYYLKGALATYSSDYGYSLFKIRRSDLLGDFIIKKLSLVLLIPVFLYLVAFSLLKIFIWTKGEATRGTAQNNAIPRQGTKSPRPKKRNFFDEQFNLNTPEACEEAVKNGWVAALISTGITLAIGILGLFINTTDENLNYHLDPWVLPDAMLVAIFAFFIYKKSRIASTLMFLYFIASKLLVWIELGTPSGLPMAIIFGAFFFNAMRATFILQKENDSGIKSENNHISAFDNTTSNKKVTDSKIHEEPVINDIESRLIEIKKYYDNGLIDEDEYKNKKKEILENQ